MVTQAPRDAYEIIRWETGRVSCTFNGRPVPHVKWHSPAGFEFGYGGSGPADLALSILAHHLGLDAKKTSSQIHSYRHLLSPEVERLVELHQHFKFAAIAPCKDRRLVIERSAVQAFLDAHPQIAAEA